MSVHRDPIYTWLAWYSLACLWMSSAMYILGVLDKSHWGDQLDYLLFAGTLTVAIFLTAVASSIYARKYALTALAALPLALLIIQIVVKSIS